MEKHRFEKRANLQGFFLLALCNSQKREFIGSGEKISLVSWDNLYMNIFKW